jgi:hypothetical protein
MHARARAHTQNYFFFKHQPPDTFMTLLHNHFMHLHKHNTDTADARKLQDMKVEKLLLTR